MTLPTLSRSWSFDVNNTYMATGTVQGSFRNFWFQVKSSLKDVGGWTVIASSNQSVANTSDNWTSTASLNWGTTTRSWIILQHPANASQILIDLSNATTSNATLKFSKNGWNTGGVFNTSTIPPLNVASEEDALINNAAVAWGNSDKNFAHHYMYSNDGYCHRHFAYVDDVCVFGLFLETPEDPVPGWATSGLPCYAMIYNSGSVTNAITNSSYTSAKVLTRIGTSVKISAYLSGESFGGGGIISTITIPNTFNDKYPLITPGIVYDTAPYRGKLGEPIDLWFGVSNFLGAITYPDDNTRQFVSHGSLITPWNGSIMKTR